MKAGAKYKRLQRRIKSYEESMRRLTVVQQKAYRQPGSRKR